MLKSIKSKRNKFEKEIENIGKYLLKNKYKIKIKNKKKFQTNLDLLISLKIKKKINIFFGKSQVISEEDVYKKLNSKSFWLVDPIDGTQSLYEGYKTYGLQLCYIQNNLPIYSLINLPEYNLNISAIKKKGVLVNGEKFVRKKIKDRVIVDNTKKPIRFVKNIMNKLGIKKYIEAGSFAYKSILIATGRASIFCKNVPFYAWDIFPQLLINNELKNYSFDLCGSQFIKCDKLSYKNGLILSDKKSDIKKILNI